MQEVVQWPRLNVTVAWGRWVAVGKREVDEERCVEGKSRASVGLEGQGGIEDDCWAPTRLSRLPVCQSLGQGVPQGPLRRVARASSACRAPGALGHPRGLWSGKRGVRTWSSKARLGRRCFKSGVRVTSTRVSEG